jgi:hypothetical protein
MINKKKMKIIAKMGMMREKKMKRKKGKNRQGKMKNTWKKGWTNMKSTKQKLKYKGLMSRIFKWFISKLKQMDRQEPMMI